MISSKGFLSPGPDRRPRMTAKHKAAIFDALSAARDYVLDADVSHDYRLGLINAEFTIQRILELYPTDRSCHTCDFFSTARMCLHWKQEVPADAVEAGCDHHGEPGAPF